MGRITGLVEVAHIDRGARRRAGILRATLVAAAIGVLAIACTPAPLPPPGAVSSATPQAAQVVSTVGPTPAPTQTPTVAPTATPSPIPTATSVPEIVVELAEDVMSDHVNDALAGQPLADTPFGPATVSWMRVDLADGAIVLSGEAQAGFIRLPVAATSTVVVESGRPLVRLSQVTVGGAVVPEPVRVTMEQALQGEVDRVVAGERFRARAVTIGADRLIVRGTPSEVP